MGFYFNPEHFMELFTHHKNCFILLTYLLYKINSEYKSSYVQLEENQVVFDSIPHAVGRRPVLSKKELRTAFDKLCKSGFLKKEKMMRGEYKISILENPYIIQIDDE